MPRTIVSDQLWATIEPLIAKVERRFRYPGRAADQIDWQRAAIDSPSQGRWGGEQTGPSPVDRGKRGCKHHLLKLGARRSAGSADHGRNDISRFLPLVDALPPVRGGGGPRRRPPAPQSPLRAPRRYPPSPPPPPVISVVEGLRGARACSGGVKSGERHPRNRL
jgi:hypothetical protein